MESLNYDVYEGVEMMKCPASSAFCSIKVPTPSHPHTLNTLNNLTPSRQLSLEKSVFICEV